MRGRDPAQTTVARGGSGWVATAGSVSRFMKSQMLTKSTQSGKPKIRTAQEIHGTSAATAKRSDTHASQVGRIRARRTALLRRFLARLRG